MMRSMRPIVRALTLAFALQACGGKHDDTQPPAPTSCDPGYDLVDGKCVGHYDDCGEFAVPILGGGCTKVGVPAEECGAGFSSDGTGGCTAILPKEPCNAASIAVPGDTKCVPVGVETCGKGFVSDGAGGCNATLPKDACPKGSMAVPGETTCHEVASCGTGTFGDIPDDPGTIYVDASYVGTSDGSKTKPFVTVQTALDAASSTTKTQIAIAAGKYDENLTLSKPVSLRGRCPAMVEVHGTTDVPTIVTTHDGVSISNLAVTSEKGTGIEISSLDSTIDRVWVHDTVRFSVFVWLKAGNSSGVLRNSLCEGAHDAGVGVQGGTLTIESSVIRDTTAGASLPGMAVVALDDSTTKVRSTLTVRGTLVERATNTGIGVAGSTGTIEATLIRDVVARSDGKFGRGIDAHDTMGTKAHADLTVRTTVIERVTDSGIFLGAATAVIESTVVRDIKRTTLEGSLGHGIVATTAPPLTPVANLTLRSSLVERAIEEGIVIAGSTAIVEKTIVRDTTPAADGLGAGIYVGGDAETKSKASATVRRCLLERNAYIGLESLGGDTIIEQSVVKDTKPTPTHSNSGFGVSAVYDADAPRRSSLTMRGCSVIGNSTSGIIIGGSDATISETIVADTKSTSSATEPFGRGVSVQDADKQNSVVTLRSLLVEKNRDVGIFSGDSTLTIESTTVRGTLSTGRKGSGIGIAAQTEGATTTPFVLTLRRSLVEGCASGGVFMVSTNGTIERSIVRGTLPGPDGEFGDGIDVSVFPSPGGPLVPEVAIVESVLRSNARAGASAFSATLAIARSLLACNAIDLDNEVWAKDVAPTFRDDGGNLCGCKGKLGLCRAESHAIDPVPIASR